MVWILYVTAVVNLSITLMCSSVRPVDCVCDCSNMVWVCLVVIGEGEVSHKTKWPNHLSDASVRPTVLYDWLFVGWLFHQSSERERSIMKRNRSSVTTLFFTANPAVSVMRYKLSG